MVTFRGSNFVKTVLPPIWKRVNSKRKEEQESNIMKTSLFKYTKNFTTKNWKFSDKNSDIFHISAQNIDCGNSLELPQWGGSNEYL